MIAGKFDPQPFFHRVENVALHVPAAEIFGFLKRTLDLPSQWAAMVRRSTGEHVVVPAGGEVDGAEAEDILFVRVTPVDVAIDEEGLLTRDRFQCRGDLALRVSVIPERGELQSFAKAVIGSHRVAQAVGLGRYLAPAVRAALAQFAAEREAAELVDARSADAIAAALAEALAAPLFSAGLVLDGRPAVRFDSKTLRQVRETQQEAARRGAEHDAARQVQEALDRAQAQHAEHLAGLLDRLKGLAAGSPEMELPELVRSFSERERGELYRALFASEPATARTLWLIAAAGNELLFFDPARLEEPCRRLTLEGPAGPIRSVRCDYGDGGRPALLIGAATGVYRLPLDRGEPDLTLLVPGAPAVKGGFNACTAVGDRVFATHSELGLCEWAVGEPKETRFRFATLTREAKAVRDVEFFDGNLYCGVGDKVIRWPADDLGDRPAYVYTGSLSTITAICPSDAGVFVGNGDGDVLHFPPERFAKPDRLHMGTHRAAESVWLLSTHGVRRLVFTDTSLYVHARVLGDSFTCRYEAGGQTLRRVEVAGDLIAATNDLRDRLICWTPGRPDQPVAIIPVSRFCGRSVQDVCLVPVA